MYGNFVLETYVGLVASSIFTIVWGWYKVLLPSAGRAAAIRKADLVHYVLRITCIVANMIGGVLGTALMPEKYKGTEVYLGNVHAILRTVVTILIIILTLFTKNLGNNIQKELAKDAAGAKVAPTNSDDSVGTKKKKKKSDAEKIYFMVNKIIMVIAAMVLYLIYDIVTAIGVVRHITPPFCEPKNLFVELVSMMQVVIAAAITYVFPIERPDHKGRSGQMETTKVGTTVTESTTTTSTGSN